MAGDRVARGWHERTHRGLLFDCCSSDCPAHSPNRLMVNLVAWSGLTAGIAIGYSGWMCRDMVSATTYTLVGVINKLLSVMVSVTFINTEVSWASLAALGTQLRDHVAPSRALFSTPRTAPRAVCRVICAILYLMPTLVGCWSGTDHRVLTGACNPMLCPILARGPPMSPIQASASWPALNTPRHRAAPTLRSQSKSPVARRAGHPEKKRERKKEDVERDLVVPHTAMSPGPSPAPQR